MRARGLLLDRDGVINVDKRYVGRIADMEFVPGIFDLVRWAKGAGFRVIVVTNQSGIARGLIDPEEYRALTKWLHTQFANAGAPLDEVLHCPFLAGAREPYDRDSFWRKPAPGMVLEAVQRWRLDAERSALIGDRAIDIEAARAARIGTRIHLSGPTMDPLELAEDEVTVHNLHEAQAVIERRSLFRSPTGE